MDSRARTSVTRTQPPAVPSRKLDALTLLFGFGSFAGASLLFLVQPMVAKMVLPLLGGSPSVWNTSMVFFQAALLGGYLYAHLLSQVSTFRNQVLLHATLLALTLALLPIGLPVGEQWLPTGDGSPVYWTLALLTAAVGAPFFVLSTTGPLLQKWFSNTDHAAASDPYFLYVASNAGSVLALLAYPLLMEPTLALGEQRLSWSIGYAAFAALCISCGAVALRRARPVVTATTSQSSEVAAIATVVRIRWVLLAAVPSSLMLGTTQNVSTDIASFPLLWVVPLGIYLVTFIIGFSRSGAVATRLAQLLLPVVALAIGALFLYDVRKPVGLVVPAHLGMLLVAALACHGQLAIERPAPARLTEFYLWLAVGGVLGGLFNAFLAPSLFNSILEYPLAIAAACLLQMPSIKPFRWQPSLSAGLSIAAIGLLVFTLVSPGNPEAANLHTERTFFGVHRVESVADGSSDWHRLWHGRTMHGMQYAQKPWSQIPTTYYAKSGPVGDVVSVLESRGDFNAAAFIGLGTGTMAAYGREGLTLTYYEIDPAVIRIASDPKFFTYISDSKSRVELIPGDARLTLSRAPAESYDLIAVDAFSSDAIPVHLVTRQAVELYLEKLKDDGILLFHVTNWHIDLAPVIGNVAADIGLSALIRQDGSVDEEEEILGKFSSIWLALARQHGALGALASDARWSPVQRDPRLRTWTDDYSDIVSVIRF